MKTVSQFLFLAVLFCLISISMAEEVVTRGSGGSLNAESSLTREWITVHDSTLPVDIEGTVGVVTVAGTAFMLYEPTYSIKVKVKEDLTAVEIRFLTFNIWGEFTRSLSTTEIVDIPAGTVRDIGRVRWQLYSKNEVAENYASIAYIARVRTKSGRVIKADPKVVLEEAKKFSKKLSENDLEPKPESKYEAIPYK